MIYNLDISGPLLNQCDIFQTIDFACDNTKRPAVLLTPECDLVTQEGRNKPKAKYLLFAGVDTFDEILFNIMSQLKITKKQRKGEEILDELTYHDFLTTLKRFFNGAIFPRYFYLPAIPSFIQHSVIDFQITETRKVTTELMDELKKNRIAKIRSSWKEAIPVRFSSYTSRIGVEDLSDNYIDEILKDYKFDFSIIK
jgi:hypothetical protein